MAIVIQRASSATVSFTTPQEIIINEADDSVRAYLYDKDGNGITSTNVSGKRSIDANITQSALPAGAATSANQTSELTKLDSIIATIEESYTPVSTAAPSAPSITNCNITSNEVIPANLNRAGIILINVANQEASFAFGADAAVLGYGITLFPGDVWEMDDKSFTTAAINGIGAAASTNIAFQEFNKT